MDDEVYWICSGLCATFHPAPQVSPQLLDQLSSVVLASLGGGGGGGGDPLAAGGWKYNSFHSRFLSFLLSLLLAQALEALYGQYDV